MFVENAPASGNAVLDRRALKIRQTLGSSPRIGGEQPLVVIVPRHSGPSVAAMPTVIRCNLAEAITPEVIQIVADTVAEKRNAILTFYRLTDAFAAFRELAVAAGYECAGEVV